MGEVWTTEHDERLKTHFDLVNSTYTIQDFVGNIVEVVDFVGSSVSGVLEKIGWDYIKLKIDKDIEAVRIDFVKEGRDTYKINQIANGGNLIYQHQDPNGFRDGIRVSS